MIGHDYPLLCFNPEHQEAGSLVKTEHSSQQEYSQENISNAQQEFSQENIGIIRLTLFLSSYVLTN